MTCPNCKSETDPKADSCSHCGYPLHARAKRRSIFLFVVGAIMALLAAPAGLCAIAMLPGHFGKNLETKYFADFGIVVGGLLFTFFGLLAFVLFKAAKG